jgi:hypothetical protein
VQVVGAPDDDPVIAAVATGMPKVRREQRRDFAR